MLARAQAEQKKVEEAVATARLAADTIAAVAARAPDAAVKSTFLAWPRVQAAMESELGQAMVSMNARGAAGIVLAEITPGLTFDDVQAVTEARLLPASPGKSSRVVQ